MSKSLSDFKISNANKSNYVCSINYDGKKEYFQNKNKAAEFIIQNLGPTGSNKLIREYDLHTDDEFKEHILNFITLQLSDKVSINLKNNIKRNLTVYSKNITVNIKTKETFNNLDAQLLQVLRYCEEDNNIYIFDGKSYSLLGSVDNIKANSISLNSSKKLRKAMLVKLEEITNKEFKDLEEYVRYAADKASTYAKAAIAAFKLTLPNDYTAKDLQDIEINTIDDKTIKYIDIAGYDNDKYNDVLLTYAFKVLINDLLPSGIFSCKLAKVQPTFNTIEDSLTDFIRFSIERCKDDRSITFTNYITQILTNDDVQVLEIMQSIKMTPCVISDDDRIAELYINKANIPVKFEGEHPRFDAFTKPYAEDELDIMLAWCYSVWHPSANEKMMLLIQTAGGTGKTTFWAAMIDYWLKKLYGEDLTLKLKHAEVNNKELLEPRNKRGIMNVALTVVDECKSDVSDFIKAYSGSDRITYTSNVKYVRAWSTVIFTKFLLLTNDKFTIQDASNAFDRRVIVINHMECSNLHLDLPENCQEGKVDEEADYFYLRCKESYERIKSKYSSLYQAKENVQSIKKNEDAMTSNEDFSLIYYNILENINKRHGDAYIISANDLQIDFENHRKDAEVGEKSFYFFRRWLKENHFIQNNYTKNVRVCNKQQRTWFLFKLKREIEVEELDDVEIANTKNDNDKKFDSIKV